MLEMVALGRRFGERWAVQKLDASIQAGEVVGFLGPNGAGKTTTIKMIAGLLLPSDGTISVAGHDVVKEPDQAKRNLAYLPDRPYIPERLSARELLLYVAGLYGLGDEIVATRGMAELERFGLAGREDELLSSYSHGMRQRVLLAAAMMRMPDVLLVDEPMVGLDPQGARLVRRVLREAADRGAVVLMSTHTLSIVEEMCDRVLVMREGELVADGAVADLMRAATSAQGAAPENLETLFLALTGSVDAR